jgi:MraZ protein
MEETVHIADLNGEFRFKADAKGRITLPSRFRKLLGNELVVMRDLSDEYLRVFEVDAYNAWVDKFMADRFGEFDESEIVQINTRRALKARADTVQVDAAGRLMPNADQRTKVGIDREVVIVGNKGYFEIWDAQHYDDVMQPIDSDLSHLLH